YEHSALDLTLVRAGVQTRGYFDLPHRVATHYEAGEEVLAIGHPRGHTHTASRGIISHERRLMRDQSYVQTDVAINPGNSGGPLLDRDGRLVGINTETVADSQGLSLAIPVDAVFAFWNDFVHGAGRLGRRLATETEVRSRIQPRTPWEVVQAAASLADVSLEKDVKGREDLHWATTRSGHVYLLAANEEYFSLTHSLGDYKGKNAALPLQLLRWQREFDYVRFSVNANTIYLGCSRDFQDLDVSEAARSMTEMEQAIDDYADKLRPHLDG
ncbi:MAG: trypsin-like peptidase domain-containing protein, partial [Gammaproteobacteria bacterium]|nr:trypsin-like peptidase domain-containing protein [Gammaproteobacteria bacterium]